MNAPLPKLVPEKCPECGQDSVMTTYRAESFDFDAGDQTVNVTLDRVPVMRCTNCGEEFIGPEAVSLRHNAICMKLGYLSPSDYKQIRESLNWSQQYLADLTGYGIATVSRAERGRQLPNRSYDITLRAISKSPAYRDVLVEQLKVRTGESVEAKAHGSSRIATSPSPDGSSNPV